MDELVRLTRVARTSVHRAANALHLDHWVARSEWRQRQLLVLCYHGVSLDDEHEWSDLYVSRPHLEQRLALLKRSGGRILPFAEAVQRLQHRDLPECAVAITFDDGAVDFGVQAAPVLAAADAHATLYLTTWYAGKPYPVFDTMASYLLWKARGRSITLPGLNERVVVPTHKTDAAFAALHQRLRSYTATSGLSGDEKHALLIELAAAAHVDFDRLLAMRLLQIMRPDEIAAIDKTRVAIELHTHRHRSPRDHDEFVREVTENQARIAEYTGDPTQRLHFCYPSGDYLPEYGTWLQGLGVETATTCDAGLARPDDNPYYIPRVFDTPNLSDTMFTAWVTGLASLSARRRSAVPSSGVARY